MTDLIRFIERVERLEEEIRALQADRTAIYAEAKAAGFDPKIMRKVVAERRMKTQDRLEQEAMLDTYRHELGMLADMPLGAAALKAAKNDGRAAPRAAGERGNGEALGAAASVTNRPVASPASPDPTPLEEAVARASESPRVMRAAQKFVDTLGPGDSVMFRVPGEPDRKFTKEADGTLSKQEGEPPDIPPFLDRREKATSA